MQFSLSLDVVWSVWLVSVCYSKKSGNKMPRGKPISIEKRAAILTLQTEGYSIRAIADKLQIKKSTVHLTLRRHEQTGSLADRHRPGPSRVTSRADDERIKLISKRNRRLTAPEIAAEFNRGRDKAVSVSTVRRRLRAANLHGRIASKKPLLRRGNRQKRLQWAKEHRNWTMEEWKNVVWSDESKFEVFGQKRRVFVRRSKSEKMLPECVIPTVKHGGGSVLVWGCFSFSGTGDLVKIDGIMKKEQYKEILERNAIPSGLRLVGHNFEFMHDNDPKHTSLLCRNYLNEQRQQNILKLMSWPPQSPDLNPIEKLWNELDKKVRKSCPTSKLQLWTTLTNEWNSIPIETLHKLIERMSRVVQVVINAKGGFFHETKV